MAKSKKQIELEQQVQELTLDLKRLQADFENYRKRCEAERDLARKIGSEGTILKLLPTIDNIERAIDHVPKNLKNDPWAKGVAGLHKSLSSTLQSLGVKRIKADKNDEFDPTYHEAVQFDEDTDGEKEVIAEELQGGYTLDGRVIRHAMVKVTKK